MVVTLSVCGMISTPKRSPSTSFTVSDTPSSVTEPFCATKRESSRGASTTEAGHFVEILARDDPRHAIDMAGDDMAAEFVADFQRALEIDAFVPRDQFATVVRASVSAAASTSKTRPAVLARDRDDGQARARTGDGSAERDAVGVIAAGDAQPPQFAARLHDGDDFAHIGDDSGEHSGDPLAYRVIVVGAEPRASRRGDRVAGLRARRAPQASAPDVPRRPSGLRAGVQDDLIGESRR